MRSAGRSVVVAASAALALIIGSCTWTDSPVTNLGYVESLFEQAFPVKEGTEWQYLRTTVYYSQTGSGAYRDLVRLRLGRTHQPLYGKAGVFLLGEMGNVDSHDIYNPLYADSNNVYLYSFPPIESFYGDVIIRTSELLEINVDSERVDTTVVHFARKSQHRVDFQQITTRKALHLASIEGAAGFEIDSGRNTLHFSLPDSVVDVFLRLRFVEYPMPAVVKIRVSDSVSINDPVVSGWNILLTYSRAADTLRQTGRTVFSVPEENLVDTISREFRAYVGGTDSIIDAVGRAMAASRFVTVREYSERGTFGSAGRFEGVSMRKVTSVWISRMYGLVKVVVDQYGPVTRRDLLDRWNEGQFSIYGYLDADQVFVGTLRTPRLSLYTVVPTMPRFDTTPLVLLKSDTLNLLAGPLQ